MNLNEEYIPWNIMLVIASVFSVIFFIISVARTGRPEIIAPILLLFSCILSLWLINRKKHTGNIAFEKHQDEAVQNIEKERVNFIKFLEQECEAEAKAAFTKFMKSKE